MSDLIALAALVVAGLSYWRARRADARSGAAILEVIYHPSERTVSHSFYGQTRLSILNKGPSVATRVRVTITESRETAEAHAPARGGRVTRIHKTRIRQRFASGDRVDVEVPGIVDDPEGIVVSWHDGGGRQSVYPQLHRGPRIY